MLRRDMGRDQADRGRKHGGIIRSGILQMIDAGCLVLRGQGDRRTWGRHLCMHFAAQADARAEDAGAGQGQADGDDDGDAQQEQEQVLEAQLALVDAVTLAEEAEGREGQARRSSTTTTLL